MKRSFYFLHDLSICTYLWLFQRNFNKVISLPNYIQEYSGIMYALSVTLDFLFQLQLQSNVFKNYALFGRLQ